MGFRPISTTLLRERTELFVRVAEYDAGICALESGSEILVRVLVKKERNDDAAGGLSV